MAVGLTAPQHVLPVAGVRLAACHSGIKSNSGVADLVLMELAASSEVAGVFTSNRFCAAPVTLARQHLAIPHNSIRYLLINSGNANAGTGEQGLRAAQQSCERLAQLAAVDAAQVLPFSTGVIGQQLPVDKLTSALPTLLQNLDGDHWQAAANGIMTTDTLPKAISRQVEIDGQTVTISGIAKGSGMIKPDMATMLAYVATDAKISAPTLQTLLQRAVARSFNAITVDGDTSTNDACMLVATGVAEVTVDTSTHTFIEALHEVFIGLAQAIVRDGEGATKFVEVSVAGAESEQDARQMAYTIAHSPLVKTALFASDANWGRILAAIGRAPVSRLDIDRVDLFLGDTRLIHDGLPDPAYSEAKGQAEMAGEDIIIHVDMKLGQHDCRIWTTDLSYEYVKINAEYRS